MGKQGPCYHCGVTSTPLWRNGPPDKPVLCNACGSRWRTKGSLTNYTPLHARGPLDQLEEFRTSKPKTMYLKHKEPKLHKVKQHIGNTNGEYEMLDSDQNYQRGFDEDTSNRSSSGSAISFSESSAHFSGADVSDVTGSSQSNAWELIVPSKRRTGVTRPKASSVEKLTKDLHSILHQQASYLSGLSEEELLYESGTPTGSVEIGNGGVLIRNLATLDEELEASSPSIENKSSYSGLPFPVNMPNKGPGFTNIASEKVKRVHAGQENLKRERMVQENSIIMPNKDSHIYCHGLPEIVSFDGFMRYLTSEEQQHLLKYLPCTDTTDPPESLKSMFSSQQFQETFSYYQMLKQEGVFDRSFAEDVDEHRILKELVMCSLSKTWVEHHQTLKDAHKKVSSDKKGINGTNFVRSSNLFSLKRPRDRSNNGFAAPKFAMKTPRKVCRTYKSLGSVRSSEPDCRDVGIKSIQASNDYTENDGSCCSPRTLFACPSDRGSMQGSLQFSEDRTDHDLLLDVRSNSSFPEAELLSDLFKLKAVPKSMSAESEVLDKDGNSCSSIKQQSRICHMLE